MDLIVEDLSSGTVEQKFTTGDFPVNVVAVRPHLYKHLAPAGSITMQLRDASGSLLASSNAVTIASITAASGNYFHGMIKFDLNAGLLPNTVYRFRMTTTGYTHSDSAYVGWCRDFDLGRYDSTYTSDSGLGAALGLEIWENKNVVKGSM